MATPLLLMLVLLSPWLVAIVQSMIRARATVRHGTAFHGTACTLTDCFYIIVYDRFGPVDVWLSWVRLARVLSWSQDRH